MRVQLRSVTKGRNKNWLTFEAMYHIGEGLYTVDFCGTEIHHSMSLSDSQNEALLSYMSADFDYAPYDIDKAKRILGRGKRYEL